MNKRDDTMKENGFWMTLGKTCGCHQMKERSFHIKGKQLFVCSRCLGIIIGYIILSPLLYIFNLEFGLLTILLMIPLIVDGSLQYFKFIESNNIRRLITGLMGGYAFGIFLINLLVLIIKLIK